MQMTRYDVIEREIPAAIPVMAATQPETQAVRPGVPGLTAGQAPESPHGQCMLDAIQRESLLFNMEASLRVHGRHHFFEWTQGLLQNLVRHELLICALRNGEPSSYHVDAFSTAPDEPRVFIEPFRRDTALVPQLIKAWEANHFEPVLIELEEGGALAASPLTRELRRVGAGAVIAHGTYTAMGKLDSLFLFCCSSDSLTPSHARLVELVVPFLHGAWMRTQLNRALDNPGMKPAEGAVLTARQLEILRWIYLGKSNIEIGMILEISPLTVKNHVQKILRKLDVQNRTQAIGKGLALRLLGT